MFNFQTKTLESTTLNICIIKQCFWNDTQLFKKKPLLSNILKKICIVLHRKKKSMKKNIEKFDFFWNFEIFGKFFAIRLKTFLESSKIFLFNCFHNWYPTHSKTFLFVFFQKTCNQKKFENSPVEEEKPFFQFYQSESNVARVIMEVDFRSPENKLFFLTGFNQPFHSCSNHEPWLGWVRVEESSFCLRNQERKSPRVLRPWTHRTHSKGKR